MKPGDWDKDPEGNAAQLRALLADHTLTMHAVAREFGCSHVTMYKYIRRLGIKKARGARGDITNMRPGVAAPAEREDELRPIGEWPAGISFK